LLHFAVWAYTSVRIIASVCLLHSLLVGDALFDIRKGVRPVARPCFYLLADLELNVRGDCANLVGSRWRIINDSRVECRRDLV